MAGYGPVKVPADPAFWRAATEPEEAAWFSSLSAESLDGVK